MNIEKGDFVKNGLGQTVEILTTERKNDFYPIVGLIEGGSVETYTKDGQISYAGETQITCQRDLVDPAIKREQMLYFNVYPREVGGGISAAKAIAVHESYHVARDCKGAECRGTYLLDCSGNVPTVKKVED